MGSLSIKVIRFHTGSATFASGKIEFSTVYSIESYSVTLSKSKCTWLNF